MSYDTSKITNEHMAEMRGKTKGYTLVLLKQGPNYTPPTSDPIVFEHGRRNFALRADGVLSIVCPVMDDTELCGIGIFDAPADEDRKSVV